MTSQDQAAATSRQELRAAFLAKSLGWPRLAQLTGARVPESKRRLWTGIFGMCPSAPVPQCSRIPQPPSPPSPGRSDQIKPRPDLQQARWIFEITKGTAASRKETERKVVCCGG